MPIEKDGNWDSFEVREDSLNYTFTTEADLITISFYLKIFFIFF